MADHTILVAGLGRCGSSLVMQMLAAAGVPAVGTYPDFEDAVVMRLPELEAQRDFAARCRGRAVKLLVPHLHAPPIGLEYRVIFLSRHPVEQAKSMLKLIGASNNRAARRAMELSVRRDTARARNALALMGDGKALCLTFENIIHDPLCAAMAIDRYLRAPGGPALDTRAMEECVRHRPATCLPFMLETELVRHG